jgi:DNA-binding LacI/PurR family transcriptional regulator
MSSNDAGPAPRYIQIAERVRRDINDGTYADGSRLPSEDALARAFGVSRGTVRQALAALTRAGVVETVPGHGSFVRVGQTVTRAPDDGRSHVVGVVIPSVARTRIPDLLDGVEATLRATGYTLLLASSGDDRAEEGRQLRRLVRDGVDGLIVYPVDGSSNVPLLRQLVADGLPLVLIDRYLHDLPVESVVADNMGGAYAAVTQLMAAGRERIGLVSTHNLGTSSIAERRAGYWWAMQQHGRTIDPRLTCADLERVFSWPASDSPEANRNRQALHTYLSGDPRPDAVFAVTDTVAFQVLEAARVLGLAVPDDLAIVGFDNLAYPDYGGVPLTTVDQPRYQIGATAARILLERIHGRTERTERVVLATRLIVRGSCGGQARPEPARGSESAAASQRQQPRVASRALSGTGRR